MADYNYEYHRPSLDSELPQKDIEQASPLLMNRQPLASKPNYLPPATGAPI